MSGSSPEVREDGLLLLLSGPSSTSAVRLEGCRSGAATLKCGAAVGGGLGDSARPVH